MRLFLLETRDCPDSWIMFNLTPFGLQPILLHHKLYCEPHIRVTDAPCLPHGHKTVLLGYIMQVHVVWHTHTYTPTDPLLTMHKYLPLFYIDCVVDKIDWLLKQTFNIFIGSIFDELIQLFKLPFKLIFTDIRWTIDDMRDFVLFQQLLIFCNTNPTHLQLILLHGWYLILLLIQFDYFSSCILNHPVFIIEVRLLFSWILVLK